MTYNLQLNCINLHMLNVIVAGWTFPFALCATSDCVFVWLGGFFCCVCHWTCVLFLFDCLKCVHMMCWCWRLSHSKRINHFRWNGLMHHKPMAWSLFSLSSPLGFFFISSFVRLQNTKMKIWSNRMKRQESILTVSIRQRLVFLICNSYLPDAFLIYFRILKSYRKFIIIICHCCNGFRFRKMCNRIHLSNRWRWWMDSSIITDETNCRGYF